MAEIDRAKVPARNFVLQVSGTFAENEAGNNGMVIHLACPYLLAKLFFPQTVSHPYLDSPRYTVLGAGVMGNPVM